MFVFRKTDCFKAFFMKIFKQNYDLPILAHDSLIVFAKPYKCICGYIIYGVATGIEDGDIFLKHD